MTAPFIVGAWRAEPERNLLVRGPEEVRVEPRVMDLLCCLAAQPGRVLSREQILERVWDEVTVGESTVRRAVNLLRNALGDDATSPRYIETVPRRGYRLLAEVRAVPVATGRGRLYGATAAILVLAVVLIALARARRTEPRRVLGIRPVTSAPGYEWHPSISPDGKTFAYVADQESRRALFVQAFDAGRPRRLLAIDEGHILSTAFSPDGERILAVTSDDDGCALITVATSGDGERSVLWRCPPGNSVFDAVFDADGREVFFNLRGAERGSRYGVFVLDLATGKTERLTNPTATGLGDFFLAPAPDGRRLGFIRHRRDGSTSLWAKDLGPDAGEERQLLSLVGGASRFA